MTEKTMLEAGLIADALTATEVGVQVKMWGDLDARRKNDDDAKGQLLSACAAQLLFVKFVSEGNSPPDALVGAKAVYPEDWDVNAFRSYGSDVANLVVAAAFLRNEIARRIANGEDTTRSKRADPYTTAIPNVSSEEVLSENSTLN